MTKAFAINHVIKKIRACRTQEELRAFWTGNIGLTYQHVPEVIAAKDAQKAKLSGGGIRVLVCGGREFNDALTLGAWLGGIHKDHIITAIIHGGARGADTMAGEFAKWQGIPLEVFPADWNGDGKAAGPIRNSRMLKDGRPDLVVAFEGGRGTADMITKARKSGVTVKIAEKIK